MANMSYCRFENTSNDLEECFEVIENNDFDDLNIYEIEGLKKILELSKYITEYENEINNVIDNYIEEE